MEMEGKDVFLRDFDNVYIFPRAYKDNRGNIISEGLVDSTDKNKWDSASSWVSSNGTHVEEHIADTDIHVTKEDKEEWLKLDNVYPVSSVFMTTSQQMDPNNLFEDTSWTLLGNSTIGSKTVYYWERTD